MYYAESSSFVTRDPTRKGLLKIIDRRLAAAYHPSQRGAVALVELQHWAGSDMLTAKRLMDWYVTDGVAQEFRPVRCPCGKDYDPLDRSCMDCGQPVGAARPTREVRYRITRQPGQPVYDPAAQPARPQVFVSYRHSPDSRLAADLYFSLMEDGKAVFLDQGSIPPGADWEPVFLKAASAADYFVALMGSDYFSSPYCLKELAHAARCRRRLVIVPVPPLPAMPPEMPWLGSVQRLAVNGGRALDDALERALAGALSVPASAPAVDLRIEACQFLLSQLSAGSIRALWNRLLWFRDDDPSDQKQENIRRILQEATGGRLDVLCNALAP